MTIDELLALMVEDDGTEETLNTVVKVLPEIFLLTLRTSLARRMILFVTVRLSLLLMLLPSLTMKTMPKSSSKT